VVQYGCINISDGFKMYHNTSNVYIFVNPNAKEGTHAFDLKRKTRLVARTRRRDDGPTAERTNGRTKRTSESTELVRARLTNDRTRETYARRRRARSGIGVGIGTA
jgi:hypothetical protein